MRKATLLIVFLLSFLALPSLADREKLDGIYTEAKGYNPFEAKIKAIDQAMSRGFLLLIDKYQLSSDSMMLVPKDELAQVFDNMTISDERIRSYASGSSYKATISFTFSQSKMNQLIQKYASDKIKGQIIKALVIPVFKINTKIFLDHDSRKWLTSWQRSKTYLSDNRLYIMNPADFPKDITPSNLLKLNYEDFITLTQYKLFQNIIIPVAELFTDRQSGGSVLRVKNIIISPESTREEVRDYTLPDDKEGLPKVIQDIISDFTKKYGAPVIIDKEKELLEENTVLEILASSEQKKNKYYVFLIDVSYPKELEIIQEKLHSIRELSKFDLDNYDSLGFKVKLYTDLELEDLAAKFYYAGLSFYYNQFQNPVLINVVGYK